MKGRLPNGRYAPGHIPWNKKRSSVIYAIVEMLVSKKK